MLRAMGRESINVAGWAGYMEAQRDNNTTIASLTDELGRGIN